MNQCNFYRLLLYVQKPLTSLNLSLSINYILNAYRIHIEYICVYDKSISIQRDSDSMAQWL